MAVRGRAFQRNPELQRFILPDVRPKGKQLGVGSYGSVEELEVNGLVCAGKRIHDALLQRDNAGVQNIERKYLEECQVVPGNKTFSVSKPACNNKNRSPSLARSLSCKFVQ